MERALLLFEPKFPCWDEETFALAGEGSSPRELEKPGYAIKVKDGWVLTAAGEKARLEYAACCGLPAEEIGAFDPEEALWNNRLYLLMERAFTGQFGVKEYSVAESFPVLPSLTGDQLWQKEEGTVRYLWPENPLIKDFLREFPNWGVAARKLPAPGAEALEKWASEKGVKQEELSFNLVLRSRYDFELYRHEAPLAADRFRLKDADRLFFLRAKPAETDKIYETLGKLHLFLLAQRRIYIPGWADIDSQEQENWTMLVLVTTTEEELSEIKKELQKSGKTLIDPARPLFITGTSLERQRKERKPRATVYDWFCEVSEHIVRPDL